MLDSIRYKECIFLEHLQTNLNPFSKLLTAASHYGHPNMPYVFWFPFFLIMFNKNGITKLIYATVTSEYLNIVLKWLFSDHRPYWWIKEYENNQKIAANRAESVKIDLFQFEETCETGPGFPSGHVMVSTCVWYIIYLELMSKQQKWLQISVKYLIVLFIISVGFSRMFISSHFPDQVFVGSICGLINGHLINKHINSDRMTLKMHVLFSLSGLFFAYFLHYLLVILKFNPDWTIEMAQKWCFDLKFVNPDTSPMHSVFKSCGMLMGSGLAIHFFAKRLSNLINTTVSMIPKFLIGIFTILLIDQLMHKLIAFSNNFQQMHFYYYSLIFTIYCLFPPFVYLQLYYLLTMTSKKRKNN